MQAHSEVLPVRPRAVSVADRDESERSSQSCRFRRGWQATDVVAR